MYKCFCTIRRNISIFGTRKEEKRHTSIDSYASNYLTERMKKKRKTSKRARQRQAKHHQQQQTTGNMITFYISQLLIVRRTAQNMQKNDTNELFNYSIRS